MRSKHQPDNQKYPAIQLSVVANVGVYKPERLNVKEEVGHTLCSIVVSTFLEIMLGGRGWLKVNAHRRRCRPALNVRSLTQKLAHVLFNCGMHTASDSTRRSRYTTLLFRTCLSGHQGKSKTRRLLCYAGRKSPSRQLDDFEIVMLNSSFIQTRRPVTPTSLLLSF